MYDQIFSLPFGINWWWSDLLNVWLTLIHKIPLKIYIGFSKTDLSLNDKSHTIIYNNIIFYNIWEKKYQVTSIDQYIPYFSSLQTYCLNYFKNNNISGCYKVGFFCELNRDVDLWFDACVIILIATFLYSLIHPIVLSDNDGDTSLTVEELLYNEQYSYQHILKLTLLIQQSFPELISSSIYTYLFWLFFNSIDPIVSYFPKFHYPNNISMQQYSINDFSCFRFSQFVGSTNTSTYIPFVFWIIYINLCPLVNTYHSYPVINYVQRFFDYISHQLPYKTWPLLLDFPDYDLLQHNHNILFFKEILKFLFQFWHSYYFQSKYDLFNLTLHALRTITFLNFFISMNYTRWFVTYFIENLIFQWSLLQTIITPTAYYMNQSYVFLSNTTDQFNSYINDFKSLSWLNHKILYSNITDWVQYEWLKYEQDNLWWTIKSLYKFKEIFVLEIIGDKSLYWKYAELITHDIDVIFDLVRNKVLVNNVYLTSKHLSSQVWLIDMFLILKRNSFEDILNTDLPKSTYSNNKTELLWKIITPFKRVLSHLLWKSLHLHAKWSITNFVIECDTSDIRFAFLHRN
jgi:hypothetical protein